MMILRCFGWRSRCGWVRIMTGCRQHPELGHFSRCCPRVAPNVCGGGVTVIFARALW
jgi:hypothetical protein